MQSDHLAPGDLLNRIARARENLMGARPAARLAIQRRYGREYWEGQPVEWMPRNAEIEVVVECYGAPSCDLAVCIASGPRELYRYFPFAAYIYVDGRAGAVVEFTAPGQEQTAVVAVPPQRSFTLSLVSELAS